MLEAIWYGMQRRKKDAGAAAVEDINWQEKLATLGPDTPRLIVLWQRAKEIHRAPDAVNEEKRADCLTAEVIQKMPADLMQAWQKEEKNTETEAYGAYHYHSYTTRILRKEILEMLASQNQQESPVEKWIALCPYYHVARLLYPQICIASFPFLPFLEKNPSPEVMNHLLECMIKQGPAEADIEIPVDAEGKMHLDAVLKAVPLEEADEREHMQRILQYYADTKWLDLRLVKKEVKSIIFSYQAYLSDCIFAFSQCPAAVEQLTPANFIEMFGRRELSSYLNENRDEFGERLYETILRLQAEECAAVLRATCIFTLFGKLNACEEKGVQEEEVLVLKKNLLMKVLMFERADFCNLFQGTSHFSPAILHAMPLEIYHGIKGIFAACLEEEGCLAEDLSSCVVEVIVETITAFDIPTFFNLCRALLKQKEHCFISPVRDAISKRMHTLAQGELMQLVKSSSSTARLYHFVPAELILTLAHALLEQVPETDPDFEHRFIGMHLLLDKKIEGVNTYIAGLSRADCVRMLVCFAFCFFPDSLSAEGEDMDVPPLLEPFSAIEVLALPYFPSENGEGKPYSSLVLRRILDIVQQGYGIEARRAAVRQLVAEIEVALPEGAGDNPHRFRLAPAEDAHAVLEAEQLPAAPDAALAPAFE